jgi:lipoate synthase
MLGRWNRYIPDAGRCVHPHLRLLRYQARPAKALDWLEPERVAQAVKAMDLKHAVITSVNRDDRKDGGAPIFAMVIRRIRELHPGCSIEV